MALIPYIIRTFRGGVSDETNRGVSGAFKHGHALDIHARADALQGKQAMRTVFDNNNTTQTGLFKWFVNARDGSTYCFSSRGSIFARAGDGAWTFVFNDENGDIRGAAEWGIRSGGSTQVYLFWATGSSLARKPLLGADITPDSGTARWTDAEADWKTTLDIFDWHTMTKAGGVLAIANGDNLATVDYEGTFNALAMNVRPGNNIKALEERDDFVIMGSERQDEAEEGHIWSWITTVQNYLQKKRIPAKGVNALITTELMLMQAGANGGIYFSDFASSTPLIEVPGGGEVYPGGVTIERGLPLFGFFGGTYPGIWSYGRRAKNRPYALNYDYRLVPTTNGSTISTVGAVANINGVVLASWGTTDGSTSEYGVDSVSSTTKASAVYEGLEFTAGSPHTRKAFNTVKLILTPMPASTTVAVKYKRERASSWTYAVTGAGATTFSQTDAVEAIFTIGDAIATYEVAVELEPSSNDTPTVHAVITYIEPTQQDYA